MANQLQDDPAREEKAILAQLDQIRGRKLTRQQDADLKWYRRKQREEIIDETLACLPKKTYAALAGRDIKVINDQADRYGLPIGDSKVDLFAAISAFHDFIKKNGRLLSADPEKQSLAQQKLQEEIEVLQRRRKIYDAKIKQAGNKLIEREDVRDRLAWMVGEFTKLSERLGKSFGRDAQIAVNEFLDGLVEEIQSGRLNVDGGGK